MTSRFTKAFVIGALATVGALAWTGCGPGNDDRYYCDNSGCYSCDAYGCSDVKAPSHPTCSSTASCLDGTICTTGGCTETCSSNMSCPKGETCQSGLCAAPGMLPGSVIDGGATLPSIDSGTSCGIGPACALPQVCVAGTCTAPQNTCQFTSECGDPAKVCAEGACVKPCTAGGTCDDGFTCTKNVCQPNQPTPTDGGTTIPTCAGDLECGTGKYCNNTVCAVDTRPKPNCSGDNECGATTGTPKKCLVGYCKYTCTTDQYCKTIDNRIGFCAKDGVCRSSTEATAQCTGPGTCPLSGQSCIDNQCK